MLVLIIRVIWLWLLRMVIPPPANAPDTYISDKTPCVACGHIGSELRAEPINVPGSGEKTVVMQRCHRCGAGFPHIPLLERVNAAAKILPALEATREPFKTLMQQGRR